MTHHSCIVLNPIRHIRCAAAKESTTPILSTTFMAIPSINPRCSAGLDWSSLSGNLMSSSRLVTPRMSHAQASQCPLTTVSYKSSVAFTSFFGSLDTATRPSLLRKYANVPWSPTEGAYKVIHVTCTKM